MARRWWIPDMKSMSFATRARSWRQAMLSRSSPMVHHAELTHPPRTAVRSSERARARCRTTPLHTECAECTHDHRRPGSLRLLAGHKRIFRMANFTVPCVRSTRSLTTYDRCNQPASRLRGEECSAHLVPPVPASIFHSMTTATRSSRTREPRRSPGSTARRMRWLHLRTATTRAQDPKCRLEGIGLKGWSF